MKAPDGATVTYDYYHPIELNSVNNSVILAICPGICNSSESVYIRRVVYHAQLEGFRVAVLNHIGALKTLPITSPRIFSYGNTIDYNMMVDDLLKRFPMNRMICVGFSMGANLVTKFIGEAPRPDRIIAGISICQGYDAKEYVWEMRIDKDLRIWATNDERPLNVFVLSFLQGHQIFTCMGGISSFVFLCNDRKYACHTPKVAKATFSRRFQAK